MPVSETELDEYIERSRPDSLNYPSSFSRELFWRPQAEADPQRRAQAAAKADEAQVEAREIAQLRQRVAQLERMVLGKNAILVKAVGMAIGQSHGELERRVGAIEAREPLPVALPVLDQDRPVLRYAGLWSSEKSYQAGDLITFNGAAWVSLINSQGLRPGDGMAWKLAVKGDPTHLKALVKNEIQRQLKERQP
jgi:hypothetical protein